jgi:hypothetical protein
MVAWAVGKMPQALVSNSISSSSSSNACISMSTTASKATYRQTINKKQNKLLHAIIIELMKFKFSEQFYMDI